MKSITAKIKNGKLLRIDFEYDKVLTSIKITGDFFLYPESVLPVIEKQLLGRQVQEVAQCITTVLNEHEAQFIGVSAQDIQEVLMEDLKQ